MIVDARQFPNASSVHADLCVVGAGAAGITIARQLAGTGTTVTVFESGGFDPDNNAQVLNRGRSNNPYDAGLDLSRSRIFGGTTSQWSGWCRPLDPTDFDRRDWIPDSGWPIGAETLQPYYERARTFCEVSDEHIERRLAGGDGRHLDLADPLVTRRFELSPPTDFGTNYRDELARAGNVTVYLNATATSFRTSETSERIDSIEFRTLSGNSILGSAKVFVLATGGIENARLLLASGDNRRYALGNENDLVGRFYMDHPAFFSAVLNRANETPSLGFYTTPFDGRPAAAGPVTGAIALDESVLEQRQLLGAVLRFVERPAFSLTPSYNSPAASSARRIADSVACGYFPQDAATHAARAAIGIAKVATAAVGSFAHARHPETRLAVRCLAESAPCAGNRVTLSKTRDALSQKRPEVTWNIGDAERRSVNELHREFAAQVPRLGLGAIEPINDDFAPPWLTGASHHIGTTRMHDSPRRGVVDRDCRVHGISNLYIAGSSVFPTCGYVNPTLTIVALALRLSDRIAVLCGPSSLPSRD